MSEYADAIGIWEMDYPGLKTEVNPTLNDARKLRNIMAQNMSNKQKRFDSMESMIRDMIKRDNPDDDDKQIETSVVKNFFQILPDMMVKFGITTQDKIKEVEEESNEEIKNLIQGG